MPQFTKQAIAQSFLKLLEKSPLDKVTVKDIVEDCGVNRNTFYYHYQDIYALIDEIFAYETQRVLDETKSFDSWQEAFLQSATFATQNKRVIFHVYNSISREKLEQYLYSITEKAMLGFVSSQANGLTPRAQDVSFVVSFYKFALVGMVLSWIGNGMKDEYEEAINQMGALFEGNIRLALERSSHKN